MSISVKRPAVFHRSLFAMNTGLDIVFWGIDALVAENVFDKIEKLVVELEMTISRYHLGSELFQLNQKAMDVPVVVSKPLWNYIAQGIRFHQQTLGYFDFSRGLTFHALKSGMNDSIADQHSLIEAIQMDQENHTVRFLNENVLIDFGAIGKGLALQRIAPLLEEDGIHHAFISFGGSSVLTRGRHPHGDCWPFSLALSSDETEPICLNNDAISVSSTKRQVANGVPFHVVDPITNSVVVEGKTVMVKNQNPVFAEVLSTALLVSPESKHKEIIANFGETYYQLIKN